VDRYFLVARQMMIHPAARQIVTCPAAGPIALASGDSIGSLLCHLGHGLHVDPTSNAENQHLTKFRDCMYFSSFIK